MQKELNFSHKEIEDKWCNYWKDKKTSRTVL